MYDVAYKPNKLAHVLSQRAKQAKVSVNAYLEAETIDCDPTPEPALSSTRRKGERGKRHKQGNRHYIYENTQLAKG